MGTILPYVGELDKIPKKWHLCDGTEGTPNLLDGKFLEGFATPNTIIEAGLPNITGTVLMRHGGPGYEHSGALYGIGDYHYSWWDGEAFWGHSNTLYFDASRSSAIYRNDITTVQPYAYTVYFIMKIKK